MSGLARDGTAEPVSRNQIFRRERDREISIFPYSADHEQDWQAYPGIHTLLEVMTIHKYILTLPGDDVLCWVLFYSVSFCLLFPSLRDNSTNQSIHQSINQPISQSTNQSINQSVNRPINQSTNQPYVC